MPDKPFTVITYAASASLAAIALIYFFNPNQLLDGDSSTSSASTRKKGIVGLSNPANDCFINSILQSLAGLGDLRLYLIRELHRRELGGPSVYSAVPQEDTNGKKVDSRTLASLQTGEVTQGLKYMLDRLNERPIYKKTISAEDFIRVLEHAFGTKISKSQQDAQELLQIVAERLAEEYYAGREARRRLRSREAVDTIDVVITPPRPPSHDNESKQTETAPTTSPTQASLDPSIKSGGETVLDEEDGFPLEGQTEAQTECQHCHFKPKASPTSFVMLNLTVPQKLSTTLNECFDAHFKIEYIDDYKCDKCRLRHAHEHFSEMLARAMSDEDKNSIAADMAKLEKALQEDPEITPSGVQLPDIKHAPKRRISRHIQITSFPKVLVIHLSRSIYDVQSNSMKNAAKISFPERLPLGGILNRRNYRLLGMVSHKGTHNSGHYESFRRQHVYPPYSTPHVSKPAGPYGTRETPDITTVPSTKLPTQSSAPSENAGVSVPGSKAEKASTRSTTSPTISLSSSSVSSPSTRPSSGSPSGAATAKDETLTRQPRSTPYDMPTIRSAGEKTSKAEGSSRPKSSSSIDVNRFKRKKKSHDRWWRISDDKIKECKTSDVLGMQKDVYLLFYEMERDDDER